jgi:predicted nucleotidyltransferase component of viral defense system
MVDGRFILDTNDIGHRISDDIDLFTNATIKKEAILDFLHSNISNDIKVVNNGEKIFQLYSDKIKLKIYFVQVPYPLINPLIDDDGIRLVSMDDISAMKISATGTRGNEAKDFVDLYYILKYMSIDTIFENFKKNMQQMIFCIMLEVQCILMM